MTGWKMQALRFLVAVVGKQAVAGKLTGYQKCVWIVRI
jgi:hypothetical protein